MDFHSAFAEIDTDNSGEITRSELVEYMQKKNYKASFVEKWLNLFDIDGDGSITYEEYCNTLGLTPRRAAAPVEVVAKTEVIQSSSTSHATSTSSTSTTTTTTAKITTTTTTAVAATTSTTTKATAKKTSSGGSSGSLGNYELSPGVYRFASNKVFKRKALYKFTSGEKKVKLAEPEAEEQPKARRPKSFPTQQAKRKQSLRKHKKCFKDHKRRLRPSITPGTVLILLAGRHRGKRVVFLQQLLSGLLLVTGPFQLNAVPLRRAHQKFVIATSKKVNLDAVQLPERVLEDEFYAHEEKRQEKSDLFQKAREQYKLSEEKRTAQKEVDSQILQAIGQTEDAPLFRGYLKSTFKLFHQDYPHRMKF